MKKKGMALCGLFMAVAITGYSVSGTYAKYTSTIDMTDEARVAKWGFNLKKDETSTSRYDINLFEDSYLVTGDTNTKVVSSEPGIKVVAPGTEGSYKFAVEGTAETNFTVSIENITLENTITTTYDNEGVTETYSPIKLQVNGGAWIEATEDALKAELAKLADNTIYPANYKFDKEIATIAWKWDFVKETGTDEEIALQNKLDTELAMKQGSIKISADLVVTQSDLAATETNNATLIQFNKTIDPTELTALTTTWGYTPEKASKVVFNGKKLTGVIEKDDNTTIAGQFGSSATGYYIAIGLEGTPGANFSTAQNPGVLDANGINSIVIALDPNKASQSFDFIFDGKTYTIDYSELIFD